MGYRVLARVMLYPSCSSSGQTRARALPMVRRLTWNSSATTSQLQFLRRPRMVARTRSASVIFSWKIPARAAGCRCPPRCRYLRRLGLGGLLQRQPPDQRGEVFAAHPGQRRIAEGGQPVRPGRHRVGAQESAERGCAAEAQDGGRDGVLAAGQDLAGLGDGLPDRELADLEHLGQDLLGADLALVDDGDQDPGGVGEQGPAMAAAGLAARAAALLEAALLGPGCLRRGQGGGQRGQFLAAHAGQPRVGQGMQRPGAVLITVAGPAGLRGVLAGRVDRVVPRAALGMRLDRQGAHALGADGHAQRVGAGVQRGLHAQPGAGAGGGDGVDDYFVAGQRPPAPVHRDVGEQPVLDLVPLARPGREVADRDGQPGLGGEVRELGLPHPVAVAVGPAGVGGDQQPGRGRVVAAAAGLPPPADRGDRERRGVVVHPDVDPARGPRPGRRCHTGWRAGRPGR